MKDKICVLSSKKQATSDHFVEKKKISIKTIFVLFLMVQFITSSFFSAQTLSDQVRESLRRRIEAAGIPPNIVVGDELMHASVVLPLFYERRGYQSAWSDSSGLLEKIDSLIESIKDAHLEGLSPNDYHLDKITSILNEVRKSRRMKEHINSGRLTDLDLLCTDAFLIYSSHLLSGRVNPITIDSEWFANRREADLAEVLEKSLLKNQIQESLQNFLPQQGYKRMRQALYHYRGIAAQGGYPLVSEGPKMQKGDRGERVVALRNRLIASGDFSPGASKKDSLFDDALELAVKRFQRRYGLDVDGVVGPRTLSEMNSPVEGRIRQIVVNMERWRWLPQSLGKRYILVNIANFELDVVEDDQLVMTMRVVVGKPYRRTPVFSDKMSYLVFNPYWNVPKGIVTKDILPEVQKDVNYLTQKKIRVFLGWGTEAREIDPKAINWSSVTAKNLPFRFRQDPGPFNALGRIKFMFPNPFDVYLHDTPSRELFEKAERAFSSGCIRVEKPIELAEYVLQVDTKWEKAKILAAIEKGAEQNVQFPEPINVHLLYWTAWVDEDGTIHFRKDLYGRDEPVYLALHEKPPRS